MKYYVLLTYFEIPYEGNTSEEVVSLSSSLQKAIDIAERYSDNSLSFSSMHNGSSCIAFDHDKNGYGRTYEIQRLELDV